MKFKYLIADTFDGTCYGTNDEAIANQRGECDEYFVMNTETGTQLYCGEERTIKEYRSDSAQSAEYRKNANNDE